MEPKNFLNQNVSYVVGCAPVEGDKFGVELELEGRNVGLQDVAVRGWQRHQDGSLRGESVEYVTNGAKTFDEATKLVSDLFNKFKIHNVKFNDSIRTSTHVHLNFSDKLVKQVVNFFSVFTLVEEVLQYYSGEDRKGNLFCISSREAEGIIGVLAACIGRGDLHTFAGDRYKYAACNLSTLYKFGTVEVRTMRGASSAEQVNNWLGILNDLYKYSLTMKSPAQLCIDLSTFGAETLMRRIFSDHSFNELMKAFPIPASLHYSLMEGARLIQMFAFEYDDAFTAVVEIKKHEKKATMLPYTIQVGRFKGYWYRVYDPDGMHWNCCPRGGIQNGFWKHGEPLGDNPDIHWDGVRQRFVYVGEGREVPLNWCRHHAIKDEGPAFDGDEPDEDMMGIDDWGDEGDEI